MGRGRRAEGAGSRMCVWLTDDLDHVPVVVIARALGSEQREERVDLGGFCQVGVFA